MINLTGFLDTVKGTANRGMFWANVHSPELLLIGGIATMVASTALACRATLKAKEEYETLKSELTYINHDSAEDPQDVVAKLQTVATVSHGMNIVSLYTPSVILGVVGIAMITKSHGVLSERNAGLLAAYKLTDAAFKRYRGRIVDELGDDLDTYIRTSPQDSQKELEVMSRNKDGELEPLELTVEEAHMVEFGASQYAKFFDDSSPQWRQNNEYNVFFLKGQQTYANLMLRTRGHLFLNEVYDMLGIKRTSAGAVVGWVDNGRGDSVVDFGIFEDWNQDFVNGWDDGAVLLDFNVDGVIYDVIS